MKNKSLINNKKQNRMKNFKISKVAAIAVYAMLAAGVSSCNVSTEEAKNEEPIKYGRFEYSGGVWSSVEYKIEERTIDSCQYIIIFGSEGRNIIHKANCRNAVHACR